MRRLGTTDILTPPMVLGGNVFGWTADREKSFALLDRFADAGGLLVDTADMYSNWVPGHRGGESEAIIGEWLKRSGRKLQVATKMGMLSSDNHARLAPHKIVEACDASLRRLGVETIDLYFAHLDDADTPQEEVLAAFGKLIDAGKVRHLGASNFTGARLKSALDTATREGLPHYHVFQPEYNLLVRTGYEGERQDLCVTHNIGVIPYFGLASGFLSGKYRSAADIGDAARAGRINQAIDLGGLKILEAMDAVAAETHASLSQIALAWLAAQPGITAPIASATSIAQLDELIAGWDLVLSKDQLDRLTASGI
jgi:aryl-alcohol dehydrogenase-like predicted oxidoreductase